MITKARAGTRSFLIAVTLDDSELADFIAETSLAGRKIEKIAVVRELPFFKNATKALPAPKTSKAKAKAAKSREAAILGALRHGPRTGPELRNAFMKAGYPSSSYFAENAKLVRHGKIVAVGARAGAKGVRTYDLKVRPEVTP